MKRLNHVLSSRALRGLHGVHLPAILVVFTAMALVMGRSHCVATGGLPEVVALPPERPGTIFYFGEGVRPAPEGETVDESPYSMASAGDVDGDGFEDLLCNANPELLGFWAVFLVHGQPSPPQTLLLDAQSEHVTVIHILDSDVGIIRPGLAAAGDVDKDGFDDMLISVPYEQRAYLLFGSPELQGADIVLPPSKGAVTWFSSVDTLGGGTPRTEKGVAALGDLNGDGSPEFAFAAPFENEGNGRVYVASWVPELRTAGEIDVAEIGDTLPGFIFEGVSLHDQPEGDSAGDLVSAAGDLNGDGFADLCVGYDREFVDVVFGSPDLPKRISPIDFVGMVRIVGNSSISPYFGYFRDIVAPGDLDGDGYDDLVLSFRVHWRVGSAGPWGRTYVVWGRPEFPPILYLPDSDALCLASADVEMCQADWGCEVEDQAGWALAAPGDIDLDGHPDILIGAPGASRLGRIDAGMAYIVYGGPDLRDGPAFQLLPEISGDGLHTSAIIGPHVGDNLGKVAAGLDFDGDGSRDIVLGAPRWDVDSLPGAEPQRPRMYLILGGREATSFLRGDSNRDGILNITDAVHTLNFLFLGGATLKCLDAADADDDGILNITDPISTLQFLFLGGFSPPPPSGTPGEDPTPDDLSCLE